MKINNFGFLDDKKPNTNKKEQSHDNKFIKDTSHIEYNMANEAMGRAFVNLSNPNQAANDKAELKALMEADELDTTRLDELDEDDIKAKLKYYKYVKTRPDFSKMEHGHMMSLVDKFNIDLAMIFAADGKTNHHYQSALFLNGNDEEKISEVQGRIEFYTSHKNSGDLPLETIEKCMGLADNENLFLLNILAHDEKFLDELKTNENTARQIMRPKGSKQEKESALNARLDLYKNAEYKYGVFSTMSAITEYNLDFAKTLFKDKDLNMHDYSVMLSIQTDDKLSDEDNIKILNKRKEAYEFIKQEVPISKQKEASDIIRYTKEENFEFIKELIQDGIIPLKEIHEIIYLNNEASKEAKEAHIEALKYLYDKTKEHPYYNKKNLIPILKGANANNYKLLEELLKSDDFPSRKEYETTRILSKITPENFSIAKKVLMNAEYEEGRISGILTCKDEDSEYRKQVFDSREKLYDYIEKLNYWDKRGLGEVYGYQSIVEHGYPENADFLIKITEDNIVPKSSIVGISYASQSKETRKEVFSAKEEIYNTFKYSSKMTPQKLGETLSSIDSSNLSFVKEVINYPYLKESSIVPYLADILEVTNDASSDFAIKLLHNHKIPKSRMRELLTYENRKNYEYDLYQKDIKAREEVYELIKDNRYFSGDETADIISITTGDNIEKAREVLSNLDETKLPVNCIQACITGVLKPDEAQSLVHYIGRRNTSKFAPKDLGVAYKFKDAFRKNNINEISSDGKKNFLKYLVDVNTDTFSINDELRKEFPLLPKNQEEYCALLPQIVKSLGIETTVLSKDEIDKFNGSLFNISEELSKLSDVDFNNLNVLQSYSTEQFVEDTVDIVCDLSREERNKVYDYFGYELHHRGKTAKEGFYLTGYPANLNNGKKLADIKDPKTKEVIEKLRPKVIEYSKQNKIICPENKEIENLLNEITGDLYELHPMIKKPQHGVHSFDLMKHTLKVMQKISQDDNFKLLNESDKKIMLLTALLHDITKQEGKIDSAHNESGAFDSYFIAKKFNLSKDEELKLYKLIKNHEWLRCVNQQNPKLREKMMKSTAYDLRDDNLFDMALIFAHADLRAVKDSDIFHDIKAGSGRIEINGDVKSFGEVADIYAGKKDDDIHSNTIRGYINELKKSQPILPVTKLPKASRIDENIKEVYKDGSTNLKGVYKDKDGLVIIKFNEVENWEELGFPKGTISKGVLADGKHKNKFWHDEDENVDTGNIKFFAHGLGAEQKNMAKFDAFSLIDSDALLSVSYTERPESKYKFFRARGLILNVDTKNIHGGGETDAGSGCGKNIEDFKIRYLFGAEREKDRLYVSKLVKDALNLTDEEYIEFVKENENKSISEITPKEAQEPLIKAYASINSKTRGGNRAYNEMYISNPEPMGVFMYGAKEAIDNPVNYIEKETQREKEPDYKGYYGSIEVAPLKEYAIERDMPMIIFGD